MVVRESTDTSRMSIIKASITSRQEHVEGLQTFLDERATPPTKVLHRRRLPKSGLTFDHMVIAPAGIWLIQAERDLGRVERRDVGDWRTIDERLVVAGRDRTELLDVMDRRRRIVERIIEPLGFSDALIRCALVFTRADWGMFTKPFVIDGVEVLWARALAPRLAAPGPMTALDVEAISSQLASYLPPKTVCTRGPVPAA